SGTFLLVAATDASGDPAIVRAAAASLGAGTKEEAEAVATGLVHIGSAVEFHHPLVRTTACSGASPPARRAAHHALAEVLGADPASADPRAWHRAAAAARPDESVAGDLVQAATRAAARGGHTTAGALVERAADLTADADRRAARVVAAGESYLVGGAPMRAQRMLAAALPHMADDHTRALGLRLLGTARYARGEAHGTTSVLLDAARALAPHDLSSARATLLDAQAASRVTGRYTVAGESELDVGRVAGEIPLPEGSDATIADLLLDGNAALFATGPEDAVALFRQAHAALDAAADDEPGLLTRLGIGSWSAGALGDDQTLHRLSTRLVTLSRRQGAMVALSIGLMFRGMSEIFDGSLPAANRWFAERAQIMSVIDRTVDVGQLVVLAWSGDEPATRAEANRVRDYAAEHRHGWMELFVEHALGALELGLGDYRAAFEISTKDYQANPFLSIVSFPNLIEAATRCGEMDAARTATAHLARYAELSRSAFALGLLARCHALTTPGDEAGDEHRRSIGLLERCRGDLQLARSRLVYGEWLRRRKRRLEAREELRVAHSMLEKMGAGAFARRAAVELAATGEHARRRSVETLIRLTPRETHIAHLAAAGATNAEIAGRLYLSASTVTHHLQKVYRKLGLSSRRQLGAALASIDR
ncbi:MAG: helix-turn-helix transcriptional regulator, partial [Acidimicrobiales bacterium]|nr:helix-turn-helix transcriptional regulator [Acidimicrobiales bacterium]